MTLIRAAAKAENFCDDGDALRLVDIPDDADATAIASAVHAVAAQKPHLIKSSVKPWSGSGVASHPANAGLKLEQLFGPGSSARLANDLALHQPEKYRRLRQEAKKKGLVG